jgi:Na+/H+-dicarboxylate symporter
VKRLSLTIWSLVALAAGLGLGILGHETAGPAFQRSGEVAKAIGAIFIAALQLTVLPLVITQLLSAISNAGAKSVGKLGVRAILLFVSMLVASGLFAALLTPPMASRISVDPGTLATLTAGSANTITQAAGRNAPAGSITDWLGSLLPNNLIEAGMRGDILTLLLFTMLFAIAVTRLKEEQHQLLTKVFQGLAEAMLQLTRWVLVATPVGVFALTYDLSLRTGVTTGGMVGAYIAIASVLMVSFTLLLYPLSALVGRTRISEFARAVAPAQLVAASTRSSIAALPALVEGARDQLRLPSAGTDFVLPLSVAVFKVNRPISSIVKLFIVAQVYGVPLRFTTIMIFLVTVIIISFGTAGIPQSGPGLKTMPAYLAAGVPIEGVIVLEAVEAIPDIFKTVLNVTGNMTAATLLTRSHRTRQSHANAAESSTVAEGAV